MRRLGFACLAVVLTLSTLYVLKPVFTRLPPDPHIKYPTVSMTDVFRHF